MRNITHYKKISIDIGKTEGNVKKVLSIMKKEGQVFPTGKGHWQLPDVLVDDPTPHKPGPNTKPDYIKSNETALYLVVSMRDIVASLMEDYKAKKGPFPKDEIHSLKTLELAYKEELQIKTQLDEAQHEKMDNFILLPHNHRRELTVEEYTDRLKYEATQLHLTNQNPQEHVIIEDDKEQLAFPFYPL